MKKNIVAFTFGAVAIAFSTVGCGSSPVNPKPTLPFNFEVGLASGRFNGLMYTGEDDAINIYELSGVIDGQKRKYTYEVIDGYDYVDVDKYGNLTALAPTPDGEEALVLITETNYKPNVEKYLPITVMDEPDPKNAGENYASDPEARTEILGKLEEYTMENMLGGITLFEQGAYVRYSSRVTVPASECITGYGWGVLTEGEINGRLEGDDVYHPEFYQTASSSDPLTINAWDATGSQVSDLSSYITSSYWSTRMKGRTDYEWYPCLALDEVDGEPFLRPIHLEPDNDLKMYKKWRIYVKTDEIAYRTPSTLRSKYNNRKVSIDDYEFVFQMLLSEQSKVMRGAELAGDTTYGIKGGQTFYRISKDVPDTVDPQTGLSELDEYWEELKASGTLGINTGTDSNGSYIDLELVNAIDEFTAMYTLSSSLYSPIPKDFLRELGGGDYTVGAARYGTFSTDTGATSAKTAILDNTLSLGAFYLSEWEKTKVTVYSRNDDWFEVGPQSNRYKIPGLVINVVQGATEDDELIFRMFDDAKVLDQTSIPKGKMKDMDPKIDRPVQGDSTFKLNVNSCDQDRWEELNKEVWHNDDKYTVKPAMSNNNFLKGLFWSINRYDFATARGATPSINYFASSYMSDPEAGLSYDDTPEHKAAVRNFHNAKGTSDDYGYNVDTARKYFAIACDELSKEGKLTYGTPSNPTYIDIDIEWMYQSDIEDYGKEIEKYFTDAFNYSSVCGDRVKLRLHQGAVTQWDDVYNKYLMIGKFDLAFGAISGNSYNPLNFMEVLKSDNSSQFTLNWGPDTSKVDELNPIVYDDVSWSFDALWAAGDHGAVIKEGQNVDPVDHAYITNTAGITGGNIYNGGTFDIAFSFVDVLEGVDLEVTKVKIYFAHAEGQEIVPDNWLTFLTDGYMRITISPSEGEAWNQALFEGNTNLVKRWEKETDPVEKDKLAHPFRLDLYDVYWNLEIYYTLTINDGFPSENIYNVRFNKEEKSLGGFSFLANK